MISVRRQSVEVERQTDMEGRTTQFCIRPGRRHGRWWWFKPDDVPPFEGKSARLTLVWVSKGKWRLERPD